MSFNTDGLLGKWLSLPAKIPDILASFFIKATYRWVALSLATAVFITTAAYSYHQIDSQLTEEALSRQQVAAQLLSATLSEKFGRSRDLAVSFASRIQFRKLVAAGKWGQAITILHNLPTDFPFIERVTLVNTEGTLMADTPLLPGVRGLNFAYRDWYQGVRRNWQPYVSGVFQRKAPPKLDIFSVAVPIRSQSGQVVGILNLQIKIESLLDWLEGVQLEKFSSIYLIDPNGQMLFHTIKSGHKIVVNIFSTPLVQKLRQEGNTAVIDFNQLKQKQSVIAYASIPEYHWGVAVMQPVHFSKVLIARDRQLMELLTGYGIILLLAVLTVILTKRVASTHQRAKGDALIMESEERYRALITGMTEGVVLQDPSGMVLTCNPSAERILGLTNAEMADRTADDPRWGEIHEDGSDYTEQDNPALVALRTGLTQYNKIMGLRRADNELIWISINAQPLFKQAETKPYAVAVTFNDISERKAAEEQIQLLAFYDPLTRLPNRRLLMDRLQHALASSSRSGREGALLFLDMDHFKDLNDTLGHETGDMLLQQVAQRLTACVRSHDTVARLGGDEFVVVLETLGNDSLENAAKAEAVGEHILAVLNRPYQLSTHEHICSTSIGITLFKDQEVTIEELMKQADIAMYQAKKQGRNMLRFFDPKMQAAVDAHAALENELHKALTKQQFQLYFQIQVDGGNRPLGAEVLLRWIHPARGFVSPVQFIPLAEESGLILTIGAWVLDTACAQLKAWQQNVYTCELVLSVNVSAKQFLQTDFVAQVQADVRKHGINPNLLKMELTEGMLVNDIEDIIVKMNALKKIGIQISLDDFGTGFSSLQYLKLLPLDQLKIDQSFVRDMVLNSNDYAIVKTIIDMAKNLKLTVIAEGVETEQQRELLFSNGCEHYQGYLFSKPLPLAEFEALLQRG